MSAENVEIVRRLYEWFAAGEAERAFEVYDAGVEWDGRDAPWLGSVGSGGVAYGHDGVRRAMRLWLDAWESIEYVADELIDAGDDVLAYVRVKARGRTSGAEVEYQHPQLWTLQEGKVVRMRVFATRDQALAAIGR